MMPAPGEGSFERTEQDGRHEHAHGIYRDSTEPLRQDVKVVERAVLQPIRLPLVDGQFDSLVSVTVKLGAAALRQEHDTVPAEPGHGSGPGAGSSRGRYSGGTRRPGYTALSRLASYRRKSDTDALLDCSHAKRGSTQGTSRRPVADSLEEAGAELFSFLRWPPEQWRSLRTMNAIERPHEEFKRRIKTQCLLPCAETACMLFWALLASGQIALRRVDGWDTFHVPPAEQNLDLAA